MLAVLFRNRIISFTDLRDGLGLTPGNVASHLGHLEAAGYVKGGRTLVDFTFKAHYRITERGSDAFKEYLRVLRNLLQSALGEFEERKTVQQGDSSTEDSPAADATGADSGDPIPDSDSQRIVSG